MADTKISALTAATSVGIGDLFAIAQAGTTKKLDVKYLWGQRTTFSNANYPMVPSDRYVATTTTTFTGQHTVSLQAANSVNPGTLVVIADDGSSITSAFSLLIARSGTDTINEQANPIVLTNAYSSVILSSDGVSNWTVVLRSPAINVVFLPSGTIYTTGIGAKMLLVECVGGGGGGGGATGTASLYAAGGGGAGGNYAFKKVIGALKASYTIAIGGAGAGGAAANGAGVAGGSTTFDSPSICTATGGNGAGTTSQSSAGFTGPQGTQAALGSTFDFGVPGQAGMNGCVWSGSMTKAGMGGMSGRGYGASQFPRDNAYNGQGAGQGAMGYGGGGDGALSISTTGYAGGNGSGGCIKITEIY